MSDKSKIIRVGVIGGGYMGKAHAVAARVASANAELGVEIRLEGVAASTPSRPRSTRKVWISACLRVIRASLKAIKSTPSSLPPRKARTFVSSNWQQRRVKRYCVKSLWGEISRNLNRSSNWPDISNLVGYNYIQTPATARKKLLDEKTIGEIICIGASIMRIFLSTPIVMSGEKQVTPMARSVI